MARLFGTDGIRGTANQDPITPEMGMRVGRAVAYACATHGARSTKIVIGRDTRLSGEMLECAIVAGVLSAGAHAVLAGVIPTPGLAFITRATGADAGIMISASHNPYQDNGFKVFSGKGFKLSDEEESRIEALILDDIIPATAGIWATGEVRHRDDAGELYLSFLKDSLEERLSFAAMKIVLDCANGATSAFAPPLFRQLGAKVEPLFFRPDGKNINLNCGSQHPAVLRSKVLEQGADVGLAFDGDGDRLIAVDEKGNALTGDQILIICAKMLKDQGKLKNNLVVSTVMSNMGFLAGLKNLGIAHRASRVGDRYVLEEMKAAKSILGGEESGHIIFLEHGTTGDGLLSAMQLLSAVQHYGQPLSSLSKWMTLFPQVLLNVPVQKKPDMATIPEIIQIIHRVEKALGGKGRVLVRYSGTEPLCRVMVEGEKKEEIEAYAGQIAEVIGRELN